MVVKMKLNICSFIISCLLLLGCNSKTKRDNCNKQVRQLNDSAVAIGSLGDTTKIMVAIELLNKVIAMKPDYYLAYWNKLTFQYRLGLMDDAFATLKSMEQINPENPDLKTMIGAFLEQNKKDSIQAMTKYKEADLLYKNILDTISPNCLSYQFTMINYILNLKLLGENFDADSILYSPTQNDYYGKEEIYEAFKQFAENNLMKKTREELVKMVSLSSGRDILLVN